MDEIQRRKQTVIKEGKIGPSEAIHLTTIAITTKVFFTSPAALMKIVGTAGWYMTLISAATAMLGFTFVYFLLKEFPGKDLIEAYEKSVGRLVGFIFSLSLGGFILFTTSIRVREFAEVLKIYTLSLSPPSFITGIFVITIAILCFLGFEPIARFARLVGYILLFAFLVLILSGMRNYEIHRIAPLLGYGLGTTIAHGIVRNSAYGEVIILAVMAKSLQGIQHIRKAGFLSIGLSAVFISLSILAYTLTFHYSVAQEFVSPMYELAGLVGYGRFFHRFDPIFIFLWGISTFISALAFFYTSISIYCKAFRIQDIRPVVLPFAVLLFAMTMIGKDSEDIVIQHVHIIRNYGWLFFFAPSVIAFIAAKVRKKGWIENA